MPSNASPSLLVVRRTLFERLSAMTKAPQWVQVQAAPKLRLKARLANLVIELVLPMFDLGLSLDALSRELGYHLDACVELLRQAVSSALPL